MAGSLCRSFCLRCGCVGFRCWCRRWRLGMGRRGCRRRISWCCSGRWIGWAGSLCWRRFGSSRRLWTRLCWRGARKIREELDALQVLGVDPVKNLVVPRFLALMLVTGLFDIYALLFGIFGGVVATLTNGAPLGPFWATFFTNSSVVDLWGSVLKCTMFGAIIAIVCCYKGMTASGGPQGVGKAVNQAVVISTLGVFAFNYVFTQTLLATHPEITVIK